MAGRPHGAHARTEMLRVRLTPEGLAVLDRLRGPLDRSAYVRSLIAADAEKKKGWK